MMHLNRKSPHEVRWKRFVLYHPRGCWVWTGARHNKGYALYRVNNRNRLAHKFIWELHNGQVPDGLELDHLCRRRGCVNPDHLEAVTHRVNVQRGNAGEATRSRAAAKTHCKHGHPLTQENVTIYSNGVRRCRLCVRRMASDYQKRNLALVLARHKRWRDSRKNVEFRVVKKGGKR